MISRKLQGVKHAAALVLLLSIACLPLCSVIQTRALASDSNHCHQDDNADASLEKPCCDQPAVSKSATPVAPGCLTAGLVCCETNSIRPFADILHVPDVESGGRARLILLSILRI